MDDIAALQPDDLVCVVQVSANRRMTNNLMVNWRKACAKREAGKGKNPLAFLLPCPKRPRKAKALSANREWFETFLLDAAIIPDIVSKVGAFEAAAQKFTAPQAGWHVAGSSNTIVWVGHRNQFLPLPKDPAHQLIPGNYRFVGIGKAPESIIGPGIDAEAIRDAMETVCPQARTERLAEAERRREVMLDESVREATVVQAPVRVMKPLDFGGAR